MKHIEAKKARNDLYSQYLHEVVSPIAEIRRLCLACENYHLCGLNRKIDALIDKGIEIMIKIAKLDEGE